MPVYAGIWSGTEFCKRLVFSAVSVEIPKYLGSSLQGVECRDTPGAQHRTECWYYYCWLHGRVPLAVYTAGAEIEASFPGSPGRLPLSLVQDFLSIAMALEEFRASNYRYLHISCHGSKDSISLTLDQIQFEDFVPMISPYLKGRRLFSSACSVVDPALANSLVEQSGCFSIIGPCQRINFDDALLMRATFYHFGVQRRGRGGTPWRQNTVCSA